MSAHPIQDLTEYLKDILKRCKTVYEQERVEFNIHDVDEAGDSVESDLKSESNNEEEVIESDVETMDDDLIESTDHEERYESSEKSTDESDVEAISFCRRIALPHYQVNIKTQSRKIRSNLNEIGEAYIAEDDIKEKNKKSISRGMMYKPAPRKPGPWRVIEIFSWIAIITTVAGMLVNC